MAKFLTTPYVPGDREEGIALLERSGYKHNPRCSICRAVNPITKMPVRAEIEEVVAKAGTTQALNYMKSLNITTGIRQLQRHIEEHAPYLRSGLWLQRTREFIRDAIEEHSDAETSIQNIINIGNKMVTNGQLPITEKMYLEALKINQKSRAVGSFKGFIKDVEEGLFQEGQVVESPKETPKEISTPENSQESTNEIPAVKPPESEPSETLSPPPVSDVIQEVKIDPGALQDVGLKQKEYFKLPFGPELKIKKKRKWA